MFVGQKRTINVRFVSVRDFRIRPSEVWEQVKEEDLIVTSNGRPIGVLARVEGEDLEQTLTLLRRVRAQMAVSRMRKVAAATGAAAMTPEEVDDEIRKARDERSR